MPKHNVSVSGDNALREFYEACGLSPRTIEGAIRLRYEEPTNFIGSQKSGEAARIAHERRRNSAEDADGQIKTRPPRSHNRLCFR
jgi:hypothetical protein